jgi:hypothetical protein
MQPDLLDPRAVIAAVVAILGVLWRSHLKADHDMEVDRNYWRDLALNGTAIAKDATTIALRKTDG